MECNLSAIKQLVFDQLDWSPNQSPEAKAKMTRAINRALRRFAEDAPFAFFQGRGWFSTQADGVPTLTTDTLGVVSGDAWTVEATLPSGTTGALAWSTDRTWDGRILEIQDADGVWHQHRVRTVYTFTSGGRIGTYLRATLYEPWHNDTDTDLAYRWRTESYYVPGDVMEIRSMRLKSAQKSKPLTITGQREAEDALMLDIPVGATGATYPTHAIRRERYGLPAPTWTPTVESLTGEFQNPALLWTGPEPTGKFDYCLTYCWGLRDQEWQNPGPLSQTSATPSTHRYSPLWESPPSPVSAQVTNGTGLLGPSAITIGLPDVDFMQGFGDATMPRYHHSGWFKRLYRRRLSVTGGSNQSIEKPYAYYLLDETTGYATSYTDNGSVTPDYRRRLREDHSYQAFALWPRPDARYELELRYIKRPSDLHDDADCADMDLDATEPLILLVLAFWYESQGNSEGKKEKMDEYEAARVRLQNRYADARPPEAPIRRRLARVLPTKRYRTF